ncbi:MAG: hypothetical protein U9R02_01510 [Thermodesulfobacteriota bacterium]|nr:hypothetical protein [Thermodesulfobacteriota bacterium]
MKSWNYGINSLYKTASIDLRTGHWWLFALERVAEFCCDIAPPIPLPNAKKRLRDQEDIELNDGNSWTTWKEWYGDLSQLFHCFVHVPIFDFCQKRIKCKFIELDYDKVKEMFYQEDKKFWDEEINL